MISDTLPEVYRSLKQEFTKKRVRTTAALALVVGLSVLLVNFSNLNVGLSIVPNSSFIALRIGKQIWWLICAVWGFYGCIEILNSLTREKIDGTWDLQRLTPLTSMRMAGGKLLGPLMFPTFVASLLTPFFVYCLVFSGREGVEWALTYVPQSLCFLIFGFCFSLLGSCFVSSRRTMGIVVFALVMLASVYFSTNSSYSSDSIRGYIVSLFGINLTGYQYSCLLALIFAGWSFKGAQWIIGAELLEAPKFWRLPSFIVFLIFFFAGHKGIKNELPETERAVWLGLSLSVVTTYLAAFFESPTLDKIRKVFMFSKGIERVHRSPLWLLSVVSLVLGTWLTLLAVDSDKDWAIYAILPLFVLRDLLIYQWITLMDSRRPQIVTTVVLGLLYIVPLYLLRVFTPDNLGALFAPTKQAPFALSIFAPLAEAALVAGLIWRKLKSLASA